MMVSSVNFLFCFLIETTLFVSIKFVKFKRPFRIVVYSLSQFSIIVSSNLRNESAAPLAMHEVFGLKNKSWNGTNVKFHEAEALVMNQILPESKTTMMTTLLNRSKRSPWCWVVAAFMILYVAANIVALLLCTTAKQILRRLRNPLPVLVICM